MMKFNNLNIDKNIDWNKLDKLVKESLKKDTTGHDYKHSIRVLKNALTLSKHYQEVDYDVLIASCLLHDIAYKRGRVENHHLMGAKDAEAILKDFKFLKEKIKKVVFAIEDHVAHFATPLRKDEDLQIESKILRDADNLDALGAVGLKRIIAFCKFMNMPDFKSEEDKHDDSLYGSIKSLIKWPETMLTKEAIAFGKKRAKIMKDFLIKLKQKNVKT